MMKVMLAGAATIIVLLAGIEWGMLMPHKTEINLLQPAVIIGIDAPTDSQDGARVTVLLSNLAESSVGQESDSLGNYTVKTEQAATVAEAVEKIQKTAHKEIPAGSIEYFLFGEGAVQTDLLFYTDLLSKDNELRLISKVYFVKGASAEDAITVLGKENAVDKLRSLGLNSGETAASSEMKFTEYLQYLSNGASFAVPAVHLVDKGDHYEITPEGYAVMNHWDLKVFIDGDKARGYHILDNTKPVHSGITIEADNGKKAVVELEYAKTKVEFLFSDKQLTGIAVRTHFSTDALDVGGFKNITKEKTMLEIEQKQNAVIQKEVEEVIALSQSLESDFLELSKLLRMKHPYRWAELEKIWPEVYAKIPIQVEVTSRLQRTYDVIELDRE